jgi:hypothetical protein
MCVLSAATSFLIDASTPNPPKAGTIITYDHYNALLNLLMQETQSRQNLETYLNQLNQKMTEMANDVASAKTKVGVGRSVSRSVVNERLNCSSHLNSPYIPRGSKKSAYFLSYHLSHFYLVLDILEIAVVHML